MFCCLFVFRSGIGPVLGGTCVGPTTSDCHNVSFCIAFCSLTTKFSRFIFLPQSTEVFAFFSPSGSHVEILFRLFLLRTKYEREKKMKILKLFDIKRNKLQVCVLLFVCKCKWVWQRFPQKRDGHWWTVHLHDNRKGKEFLFFKWSLKKVGLLSRGSSVSFWRRNIFWHWPGRVENKKPQPWLANLSRGSLAILILWILLVALCAGSGRRVDSVPSTCVRRQWVGHMHPPPPPPPPNTTTTPWHTPSTSSTCLVCSMEHWPLWRLPFWLMLAESLGIRPAMPACSVTFVNCCAVSLRS